MKKHFTVRANGDALKYQVIDSVSDEVKYEHDAETEAETVCGLLNEAYFSLLEKVAVKTTDALREVFELSSSPKAKALKSYVDLLVFSKDHEITFVSVMSKELSLQLVDSLQARQSSDN